VDGEEWAVAVGGGQKNKSGRGLVTTDRFLLYPYRPLLTVLSVSRIYLHYLDCWGPPGASLLQDASY
jgi:hypothetical protein